MADTSQANEGRLPLLAADELNREQRNLYDRIADGMLPWAKESGFQAVAEKGRLLGPFNAMLYNPELGAAMLNYLDTERNSTELDAPVREIVILTVGAACQSSYELYAHRAVAEKAGLAPEVIETLASGAEPQNLDAAGQLAHRFTRALVQEHRIPDDLFAQAAKEFGLKGLVDMVHLISLYLATSALLNAFAVPVPAEG